MISVDEGSLWRTSEDKRFRVLKVIKIEDNVWVHYREESKKPKSKTTLLEYSCYIESFLSRFNKVIE